MKTYRIYINTSTLIITAALPENMEGIQQLDEQNFNFKTLYQGLGKQAAQTYLLLSTDPKASYKAFRKNFVVIKASGGLVSNANGEYLFIFRNKKWDLPKGKVEKGEGMREAGIREVEEECGVKISSSQDRLCKTYHIYELGGKLALKRTNWYSMKVKGSPKLVPQKEEGITQAEWLQAANLKPVLENTFPSIIDVLKAGKLIEA